MKKKPGGHPTSDKPKSTSHSDQIEKDIDGIRDEMTKVESKYRRGLYEQVQEACLVAEKLMKNPKAWTIFCARPFWTEVGKPPVKGKPKDALRFVLRLVCGAEPSQQKNASLYYRATTVLLKKNIQPGEIATQLEKRGGFRRIASKSPAPNKRKATNGKAASIPRKSTSTPLSKKGDSGEHRVSISAVFDQVNFQKFIQLQTPRKITLKARLTAMSPEPTMMVTKVELRD